MMRPRRRDGACRSLLSLALVVTVVLVFQGCAAIGLTALTVAAGTGAGAGVGHTLDSITYKTFSVPLDVLSHATVMTLDRLDMPVMETENTETGQTITAEAGDRTVEIELDRMTTGASRMRVVVKKNWLIRDRATATEIILQTDRTLTDNPSLARADAKAARPSPRTTQHCMKGAAAC